MPQKTRTEPADIAIIGVSCLFPSAEGLDAFWSNILEKVDAVGLPTEGWGAARHLSAAGGARITTPAGGFLRDLYKFDPGELGVMPTSVDGGEPDQFLALKIARDALADAGYLKDGDDHTKTGIILGHSTYLHRGNANVVQHGVVVDQTIALLKQLVPNAEDAGLERVRAALLKKLPPFNADIAPGLVPNVMTGRIANKLNLMGPNYLIDAACASSLLATGAAIEELRSGRSDLMLAGGVNAALPAEVYMVFTQLGALAKSSKVRPFSQGGDGTLLGEGLGVIVLKRLADAQADGDKIYALIKSVGHSSDGRGSGLLAPRLEGEVLAMRRAYEEAGVDPTTIGLIEAHGTGIPLGDRTEITALRQIFGERVGDLPRAALGSVKSMIGHCIPAAGIAGLIKTAMALRHKTLPPTLCDGVNPDLGIETTRFYVNSSVRPWLQPMDEPRRAAVNAFGFGGINTHAILQEAPAEKIAPRPRQLGAELIVLAAEDQSALVAAADALLAKLQGPLAGAALSSIALALAARAKTAGPARLALVASDKAELAERLAKARDQIAKGRASLAGRSGHFSALAPLKGKLAFVFPGEGAQYQGMLAEILMAFPEAREWFDFWEGLFTDQRDFRPSDCVFPPPTTLDEKTRAGLEQRLFTLELGSESVFVASQALLAVTRAVGLKPEAVVGNSSGEHSALRSAGVFGREGWDAFGHNIRELNRLYTAMAAASHVEGGALLTVGAVPRARILALVEDGSIHLALDNCHQQSVLYGERAKLEAVASTLGREGGLCAFLPFDRPYHTPLFAPIAEMVEGTYRKVGFQKPQVPIYSCVNAAPMPDDPEAIRALAAEQWRSRVRFTETIARMYEDGFRLFLEVGPSATLTGFVENILQETENRGKDALALSLDSRRRGGLKHLLSTFGKLWAAGAAIDLGALYAGRDIAAADLNAQSAPKPRERVYANTLAGVRFDDEEAASLRAALMPPAAEAPAAPPAAVAQDAASSAASPSASEPGAVSSVLHAHFGLMQQFLDQQARTIAAAAGVPADEAQNAWPFLETILVHEDERLVATCLVDPERHTFVRDHVLYASAVSDLDPSLTALPVVPFAVSMEMMAEAASALEGEVRAPSRFEEMRALNWVALDRGARLFTIKASRIASAPGERRYAASVCDENDVPLVDAQVVFADSAGTIADVAPLAERRASIWGDEELYQFGMFHGPLFQSVAGLEAWDESGLDARLFDTPLDDFFGDGARPQLLLNPVLLDAIGHVTAFWLALKIGTDFSSFPSRIERIDLIDAAREDTGGGRISGRLAFEAGEGGARFLTGDFTAFGPDGAPLFRASGWRDRFFDVEHRFYFARWQPREGWYGEEETELFPRLPEDTLVWAVSPFAPGFLDQAGGVWRRVLSMTILSAGERAEFDALPDNAKRRNDWLMGRIALKEAARAWIERRYGVLLLPADIAIRTLRGGKPYVAQEGLEDLGPMPEVSMAHTNGHAVAVAAPPGEAVGIDYEIVARIPVEDVLAGGFSQAEQALIGADANGALAERVAKAWCAKEATAKYCGTGLNGQPRIFVVRSLGDDGEEALVEGPLGSARVCFAAREDAILAIAFG